MFLHINKIIIIVKYNCAINKFWFCVFHGVKPFHLYNIKCPTTSIFVPRKSTCIHDLYIFPYFYWLCGVPYVYVILIFLFFFLYYPVSSYQYNISILPTTFLTQYPSVSSCHYQYTSIYRSTAVACWMTYL